MPGVLVIPLTPTGILFEPASHLVFGITSWPDQRALGTLSVSLLPSKRSACRHAQMVGGFWGSELRSLSFHAAVSQPPTLPFFPPVRPSGSIMPLLRMVVPNVVLVVKI